METRVAEYYVYQEKCYQKGPFRYWVSCRADTRCMHYIAIAARSRCSIAVWALCIIAALSQTRLRLTRVTDLPSRDY